MDYLADDYVVADYIGQPGSLTRFALGVTTLNFETSPLRPRRESLALQPVAAPASAPLIAGAIVIVDESYTLTWPGVRGYYLTRLLDFWRTTAKGMAVPFLWRDATGVERTVTFAEPTLPEIAERVAGRYPLTLTLRVEP